MTAAFPFAFSRHKGKAVFVIVLTPSARFSLRRFYRRCPAPSFVWMPPWGASRRGGAFCFRGGGTADRQYFRVCILSRSGSAHGRTVPGTYLPARNLVLSQGRRGIHGSPAQNLRCLHPCQRSMSMRRHVGFGGRYRIESVSALCT